MRFGEFYELIDGIGTQHLGVHIGNASVRKRPSIMFFLSSVIGVTSVIVSVTRPCLDQPDSGAIPLSFCVCVNHKKNNGAVKFHLMF